MNDLTERLSALRTTPASADDAIVSADVRRGRSALGRRRMLRGAAAGALAVAIGGVGTAVAVSSSEHQQPAGLRLVTYTGEQLPGFTITKVPEGFVLQGVDSSVLDIARPGDHTTLDDFEGKIVVSIEDSAPSADAGPRWSYAERTRVSRKGFGTLHYTCPDGTQGTIRVTKRQHLIHQPCGGGTAPSETAGSDIAVDGSAGKISTNSEGAKYFRYTVGDRTVTIQVWPTIELSDAQLRELADGVTVNASATLSHG